MPLMLDEYSKKAYYLPNEHYGMTIINSPHLKPQA